LFIVEFHRREDDLKNDLKNTKERVRSLEVNLQEVEAGAEEIKQLMKGTIDSKYAVSQNLAYEKQARKDLEVSLEVALKALQNEHVIITGQEVELNDLKNVVHFAMDILASQVEGEEPKLAIDRLLARPKKLLDLLKATSFAAATKALVWVKSHSSDIDLGSDATKDPKVLELEVHEATTTVMDALDYEGGRVVIVLEL
jgi:chromosome segregation ATPase